MEFDLQFAPMAESVKKILHISDVDHVAMFEGVELIRVSWSQLESVKNFADYDDLIINFAQRPKRPPQGQEWSLFNGSNWAHVLQAKGKIVCIGLAHTAMPSSFPLSIQTDPRPFDFGRTQVGSGASAAMLTFLKQVVEWSESLSRVTLGPDIRPSFKNGIPAAGAHTKFETFVGAEFGSATEGKIVILPATGKDCAFEDALVLKLFFSLDLKHPRPAWLDELRLPGENERIEKINFSRAEVERLTASITDQVADLDFERRWYSLLFADGPQLETIVREALEALDVKVEPATKEKEDWRLFAPGGLTAVTEIKGTHNPVFKAPALRSLAHWMDMAAETTGTPVKGIFIGNSNRLIAPTLRGKLFEESSSNLALARQMTILRTVDLLCLVMLKTLKLLDAKEVWQSIFRCVGQFNASPYHTKLPEAHRLLIQTK